MALPLPAPLLAPKDDDRGPSVEVAACALSDLPLGTEARVLGIDGADAIGSRLLDLGFVRGTAVRAVRRAPLGDPVVYELRGYRLCLRRTEASRIRVRPTPRVPA